MAKKEKVERVAVILPDGTKSDIEQSLVKKYRLTPGDATPFTRAETATVIRTVELKKGPKDWTPEEDEYLFSNWDIVARNELAKRLSVSPTTMSKRYKKLLAAKKAEQKKAKKSSPKKKTKGSKKG